MSNLGSGAMGCRDAHTIASPDASTVSWVLRTAPSTSAAPSPSPPLCGCPDPTGCRWAAGAPKGVADGAPGNAPGRVRDLNVTFKILHG